MKLKDAALDYAKQGWPIFPCNSRKEPYTERGVLESTTNPETIKEWWNQWPKANIGFDCGSAGMVALDLDPGHDWNEIEEAIGKADTALVQRTPRGGEHLFFRLRKGEVVPASQSKIASHVDVRSHHSYVLLWPSRTSDGEYSWEEEGEPADRPDGLIEAVKHAIRERKADHDTWVIEPDLDESVALAIKYLKTEAQPGVVGLNGDMMAYRTAAMCKSFGLSHETAFDLMWEYWCPRCEPPWDEGGVENLELKISNAYTYNTSPPGNLTPAYKVARHQKLFQPVVSRDTKGGLSAETGRFRFVDERGVEAIKPPEWLIEGLIPQHSYSLLIGPRATYKSFLALDIALSIATGGASWYESESDWRGPWPNVITPGPVLYAAGEGRAGFKSRVESWKDHHIEGEYTDNFYLVDPVPYPEEDDISAFIEGALALQDSYELVILDTVGRAMQGLNENSQQDASQLTRMVQTIQYELDCAVMAVHHTGHGANGRARGSSVFGADIDSEFIVEKYDKNMVRLRNTKQKDAAEWDNARLIQLRPHLNSLVACKVTEKAQKQAEAADLKEPKDGRIRSGRRKQQDLAVELSVVRSAAYRAMKAYPGKEWTKAALASAISADEAVSVVAGTIRNKYIDELLTDKKHPVSRCFDAGRSVWIYRP